VATSKPLQTVRSGDGSEDCEGGRRRRPFSALLAQLARITCSNSVAASAESAAVAGKDGLPRLGVLTVSTAKFIDRSEDPVRVGARIGVGACERAEQVLSRAGCTQESARIGCGAGQ